jgi:hypothetical protein
MAAFEILKAVLNLIVKVNKSVPEHQPHKMETYTRIAKLVVLNVLGILIIR